MVAPDPQPESRIFISYRREDSSGHVLALLPALRAQFGADRIFKDTDNIPAGVDFVKFIKHELETCAVLLAIIGRDWLTVQDPRLKRRRLDNPEDFLRVEVATALKNEKIRVIPVLVERGAMPAAEDLPPDLTELTHRNAIELSDIRWESDVRRLIEAIQRASAVAPVETAEAPAQRPELQNLQKRRAREIATHVAAARDAFATNDYEAALWACEKALVLDPHNTEALELLDRARKALDQQKIDGWLNQARTSLSQGDLGNASELIDQALALEPTSNPALALRQELLQLRREREQDRERARLVDAATTRARASLDEEDFESAVRHAEDALALAPDSAVAQDVRSKAVAALDERRRAREHKRRAQQAVADARGKFAAGEHEAGLRLLRDFSPAHDLVSQALLELQKEADAEAGLAAAVAAEAARRVVDARLAEASTKFQQQDYLGARQLIEAARSHDPQHPDVARWLARVDAAMAEQVATAQRAEAVRAAVTNAQESFQKGDVEAAIRHADAALTIDPSLGEVKALRKRAHTSLTERRAREERERLAGETIERARRIFKAKDYKAAINLLEAFTPPHALVNETVAELRRELQQIEARQRQQEEEATRLRAEAERLAAERKRADAIRRLLARGRASLDREDFPAAVRDADELLRIDPDSAEARQLRDAATALLQERNQREERDRLAEQAAEQVRAEAAKAAEEGRQAAARARERDEAERRQKALVTAISRIESSLAAGQLDEAERLLAEAEGELPASPDIAALRDRAKALRGREVVRAREERIRQLLAEAQSAFTAREFKSARRMAAAVLELAPENPIARSVLTSATRELRARTLEFWKTRGVWGLAAAVLVMSTVIGLWYYGRTSGPSSQPETTQGPSSPGSASAPAPANPTQGPVPGPAPTEESPLAKPPESKTPTPEETRQQRLEVLRGRARGQVEQGQRLQALGTLNEGLQIDPGNRALQSILDSMLIDAQRTTQRAKTSATDAGAAALPQTAFTDALKLEDEATRARAANKKEEAIRSFWDAAGRFNLARRQAIDHANEERLADERAKEKERADERARQLADEQARQKQTKEDQGRQKPTTPPPGQPREETKTAEKLPLPVPDKSDAASAPKPLVVTRDEELRRVTAAMQRYEAAHDNLNGAEVKAVYPSLPADPSKMFAGYRSYNLGIEILKVDLASDGSAATVVARVSHDFRGPVGGRQQGTVTQTFTLQKQGNAWVIVQRR